VRSLVREFAEGRGGAVFVCTHTLTFAEAVCHRVGLLRGGRLVAEGDLPTLRQQAGLPGASLEALYLHLARAGDRVTAGGREGGAPRPPVGPGGSRGERVVDAPPCGSEVGWGVAGG